MAIELTTAPLSAIIGIQNALQVLPLTTYSTASANWQSTFTTVLENSGTWVYPVSSTKNPSLSTDEGVQGQIFWDTNYIYVCIDTNTWKRVSIASWN